MSLATTHKSIEWIQFTGIYRLTVTHEAQAPLARDMSLDLAMHGVFVLRLVDWLERMAVPGDGLFEVKVRLTWFAISAEMHPQIP